jgi:hypothetical protein
MAHRRADYRQRRHALIHLMKVMNVMNLMNAVHAENLYYTETTTACQALLL